MGKAMKGAAVTGVAAIAVLAALFGTGKLGFGTDMGLSDPGSASEKEQASVVETVASTAETPEITYETEENGVEGVEIRIQGREYNYRNVTYGNKDHTTEELLAELSQLPRDTRIDLIVEDNATKNAVDELVNLLVEAGFSNVRK